MKNRENLGRGIQRKRDLDSLLPGEFITPDESDHVELLRKSAESRTSSSESTLEKRSTPSFWQKLASLWKKMKMRYLRILRKRDFDDRIAHEMGYMSLVNELESLKEEESEYKSKLKGASSKGKEYADLIEKLQEFDLKLSKAYDKYLEMREQRKELVDSARTQKAELHDASQQDIKEFSRRVLYIQRQIAETNKKIASYRNRRYSELCDEITKRKFTGSR